MHDQYGSPMTIEDGHVQLDMNSEAVYLNGPLSTPIQVLSSVKQREGELIADSQLDFSISNEGTSAWTYGWRILKSSDPAKFSSWKQCEDTSTTLWKEHWEGLGNDFVVSAKSQHPTKDQGQVICPSRRWTAPETGRFRFEVLATKISPKGDGTSLFWFKNETLINETSLPSQSPTQIIENEIVNATKGETWELVVGPGDNNNTAYDTTHLDWLICRIPSE